MGKRKEQFLTHPKQITHNAMRKLFYITLLLTAQTFLPVSVNAQKLQATPSTYKDFCKRKDMKTHKGFFTIYEQDNRYFIEIPCSSFGKDILATTQVVKGYSSYVSNSSGIIRLSKGSDNTLNVTRLRNMETRNDTTDITMKEALEKSSLQPIDYTFPIEAYGEGHKSVIIELTGSLNTPTGLFGVNNNQALANPDPSRSGIDGSYTIPQGVVFSLTRSQSDFREDMATRQKTDIASTYQLEVLLQQLPENHVYIKKKAHPAYGFSSVLVTEYDARQYLAKQDEYIYRWSLQATPGKLRQQQKGTLITPESPITVYIDPITPQPFTESIKRAIAQWEGAFNKAGWKNVFRISSKKEDASLSYHTILFKWGNAFGGPYSSLISNPQTGEILSARINIMDVGLSDLLPYYFLRCGAVDKRAQKNTEDIEVRKDLLTVQAAAMIGEVMGLKPDIPAATAFTPTQLRSAKWTEQYGSTASITSGMVFNYLAKPEDGIRPQGLLPRVSIYDDEAIQYAYGPKEVYPSLKATWYAPADNLDPSTQSGYLSSDFVQSNIDGIEQLKKTVSQLTTLVSHLPIEQNSWESQNYFYTKILDLYNQHLKRLAQLIGARRKRPVVKGLNDQPVTYYSREDALKALDYLEKNIFNINPSKHFLKDMNKTGSYSMPTILSTSAVSLLGQLTNTDVIQSLVTAEEENETKNLTAKELFAYINRIIFNDFNRQTVVPDYKQRIQASFIDNLSNAMNKGNISFGISNEGTNVLHSYFMQIAEKIRDLSQTHADSSTRANYQMMVMRMNKNYFNK